MKISQCLTVPRAIWNVLFDVVQNLGVQRGALGLALGVQRGALGHGLTVAKIDHIVQADSYFVLWLVVFYIGNPLIHVMRFFPQLFVVQKTKPAICRPDVVFAAGK
jgi:hypothetical protein